MTSNGVSLATSGAFTQGSVLVKLATGSVTYRTTRTGTYAMAAYDLSSTCERLE